MSPRNGATASKGGVGVGGEADSQPERTRVVDAAPPSADLDVHGATVRPRRAEGLEVAARLAHHEVTVEEASAVASQRRHDRRSESRRSARSDRP